MSDTQATAKSQDIRPRTQSIILLLLDICKVLKFPSFFVDDFLAYQKRKNWIHNGEPIKNPAGVFTNWAKIRRQSMIINKTWRGSKDENWDYTRAVFLGFKKAKSPETENYIKTIIYKISHAEPMTQQESDHAAQMGIFREIEFLKDEYKNDNPDKDTTPNTIFIVSCPKCGFRLLSYETTKNTFCVQCGKSQVFEQITKEDF